MKSTRGIISFFILTICFLCVGLQAICEAATITLSKLPASWPLPQGDV